MHEHHLSLVKSIEDFIYLEADLLDERRFDEWLDLLHPDLEYAMPVRQNVHSSQTDREFTSEGRDVMWFDEDKETLTKRVRQLQTGEHWAEEPVSRISHLVTNIRVVDVGDQVEVSSRFLVYRNRVDIEADTLIGRRRDWLIRSSSDSWLLRRRVVLLDQSVLLAKNLTLFF